MGFIKEKEGRIYLVLRDEPFFLSTLHHALRLSYSLELLDDYRNYDIDTFLVLTQRYLLVKEFSKTDITNIKSVLMDCKKQKISAVRDFPKGCGEQGRAIADTLNNLLEAGWELGMLYDSESVVTSAVASGEHRGTDMTKSLNLEGLSGPLQTLKHEATELSKKAVTRVYPSHRRTSGTRHFPEGCARKTSQSVNEVVWESNPSKANGLENVISCVEDISAEVRIKRDTQKSEAAVGILAKRGIAATRCFPDYYREEALGSKPNGSISECGRVTQGSKPSGSIRECGRMIRSHGHILTDWDRVIVMGLMASHKCPWRQGKGPQKPAGNTGVAMGKDTSRGRQISSTMRKGKSVIIIQ